MRWLIAALVVAIILDLALLLSGYRVLVGERIVQPGEHYIAGDWEDVGEADAPSLVCWYWTGRSTKPIVWWYGSGPFASKDECPFLHNPSRP